MRRRLSHRIYFFMLVATLASIGLTAVVAHHLLGTSSLFSGRIEAEAELVAQQLPPEGSSPVELAATLARLAGPLGADLALVGADGAAVASTQPLRAPHRGWPAETGWAFTAGGPTYLLRLTDGRRLVFRPQHQRERHLSLTLAAAMLFLALAGASYPIARHLTRQVEALERGVERLGSGDLGVRVTVEGSDEVARLAERFNWAAERIERLLESQRRTLAGASHELRSPLARLRLALELIERETSGSPAHRAQEAVAEIAELDELVEDILLASRLQAGMPGPVEPVDLAALLASEAAQVGARVEGGPVSILGEQRALKRLVRNLLDNAVRHGGGAQIVAGVEPLPAGGARLWVADAGPGVDPAERERIFEPFYRLPGVASGAGLGLALVRQIAERHGGTAVCRERECGGTVFEVTLREPTDGGAAVRTGIR